MRRGESARGCCTDVALLCGGAMPAGHVGVAGGLRPEAPAVRALAICRHDHEPDRPGAQGSAGTRGDVVVDIGPVCRSTLRRAAPFQRAVTSRCYALALSRSCPSAACTARPDSGAYMP